MNKKSSRTVWVGLQKALVFLLPLAFMQTSQAVVTAHFVEEADGVRISFSGTLAVDPNIVNDTTPVSTGGSITGSGTISIAGLEILTDPSVGVATIDLTTVNNGSDGDVPFGFNGSLLFYSSSQITGGELGAVSELTIDPSVTNAFFSGQTLESLNADEILEGFVLWTANTTNDTIVFSTAPVPEPSVSLLGALAGAFFLRRRR